MNMLDIAADLIKDHPAAAEMLARRAAQALKFEANRAEELRGRREYAERQGDSTIGGFY